MKEVEIRLAVPRDAETIAEIIRTAFGEFEHDYTPESFAVVTPSAAEIGKRFEEGPQWVAEVDGAIVGTVSLSTEPEGLYVRSMAVRPDAQGRGVGHELMNAVNEYADESDHERIFLYTTYFVPGAKRFYESHGYKWVRDTTAEEWYGTPGLEMERTIEKKKQNATGS